MKGGVPFITPPTFGWRPPHGRASALLLAAAALVFGSLELGLGGLGLLVNLLDAALDRADQRAHARADEDVARDLPGLAEDGLRAAFLRAALLGAALLRAALLSSAFLSSALLRAAAAAARLLAGRLLRAAIGAALLRGLLVVLL